MLKYFLFNGKRAKTLKKGNKEYRLAPGVAFAIEEGKNKDKLIHIENGKPITFLFEKSEVAQLLERSKKARGIPKQFTSLTDIKKPVEVTDPSTKEMEQDNSQNSTIIFNNIKRTLARYIAQDNYVLSVTNKEKYKFKGFIRISLQGSALYEVSDETGDYTVESTLAVFVNPKDLTYTLGVALSAIDPNDKEYLGSSPLIIVPIENNFITDKLQDLDISDVIKAIRISAKKSMSTKKVNGVDVMRITLESNELSTIKKVLVRDFKMIDKIFAKIKL